MNHDVRISCRCICHGWLVTLVVIAWSAMVTNPKPYASVKYSKLLTINDDVKMAVRRKVTWFLIDECSSGAEKQSSQLQVVETGNVSAQSVSAAVTSPTEPNFASAADTDAILTGLENGDSHGLARISAAGDSLENYRSEEVSLSANVRNSSPFNHVAETVSESLEYYVSYSSPCSDLPSRDVWLNDAAIDRRSPSP
jgi:hypothetical protein